MPIRCPKPPAPFPSEEYPPVFRRLRAAAALQQRYVLSVVYRDGVPRETGRFYALAAALTARDVRRRAGRRTSEHWMVHDAEDEERGYLDWEDA